MVLTSTLHNKENVLVKSPKSRRVRSHPHNSGLASSSSSVAREAARRARHSAPVIQTARPLGLATDKPPAATPAQRRVSLPKSLPRPAFRAISPAAISAISPDLEGVSTEYIIQRIRGVSQQLSAAVGKVVARCPKGRLPHELNVIVEEVSPYTPTHLLAVYSQASALQKQRITLHPAHSLVLAANCANLPPLPPSGAMTPDFPGRSVTLPVVPLCLPNTITFPLLLDYLYRQNTDRLLTSLLSFPLPENASLNDSEQLARKMAASFTVPALLAQAHRTHGLWSNVAALGVFDENLWLVLETAWEILLGALAVQSGEAWSWKKSA